MYYDPSMKPEVKPVDEVGDALLECADLLERVGWCQFALRDKDGGMCLVGVIGQVAGARRTRGGEFLRLSENMSLRVRQTLGIKDSPIAPIGIVDWNNAMGRKKEEVVALLRRAANP